MLEGPRLKLVLEINHDQGTLIVVYGDELRHLFISLIRPYINRVIDMFRGFSTASTNEMDSPYLLGITMCHSGITTTPLKDRRSPHEYYNDWYRFGED